MYNYKYNLIILENMEYIGVIGENSVEFVEKIIDVWNNKSCAVLIDYKTPFESILEILCISKVSKCYIDESIFLKYETDNVKNIQFLIYKSTYKENIFLPDFLYEKYKEKYTDEPAVIIFSSGTTGKSKGVILSHYAINKNADMISKSMNIQSEDIMYIVKKLTHSSALIGELLVCLKNKAKLLIGPIIVPARYIIRNILEKNVTILCLNPALIRMVAKELVMDKYHINTLKKIYVTGDKFYKKDCEEIRKQLSTIRIYNGYGLTEAGPRVSMQNECHCTENSVGVPLDGVKVKIVNSNGAECTINELGIIHVKTTTKYLKYVGDEKHFKYNDEWINTGDIGYYQENGEFFVTDRLDDLIIINSHNIYPNYIESKILDFTSVKECCVIKYSDDSFQNQTLCCLYTGTQINIENLRTEMKKIFIEYEVPRYFFRVRQIPKNDNGKRNLIEIRKMIKECFKGVKK